MLKVGIIRCHETEDYCPGTGDFRVTKNGKGAFEETGPVEIVGFVTCGGCPGKKAALRAQKMLEKGAEAIVFASCITRGNPIGYPCPHFEAMKASVIKKIGNDIKIFDWTH